MQNTADIVKKAKRHILAYRLCYYVMVVCVMSGFSFVIMWQKIPVTLFALFASIFIIGIGNRLIFKSCIESVLIKKLDTETYFEIIRQGKFDTPRAAWQLLGEYFCGNYQNVVNICKLKLDDSNVHTRYDYFYYLYLANTYFDIGDDDNLRQTYQQYEEWLATQKPKRQAKYRSALPRMTLYDLYLKKDMEACITWCKTPAPLATNQHFRTFCKARLAFMQGNIEEACSYYKTLAKEVPQLNYGKLATKVLAQIENQDGKNLSQIVELSNESQEVVLYSIKSSKWRKIYNIISIVLFLSCIVLILSGTLDSQAKYERELKLYKESVRLLVEEDYDNVEVLDAFNLRAGEEIIDSMFVCKTDTDVIVGCVYIYEDSTEKYYEKMTDISIASLQEERSPLWYCSFSSVTSDNHIESYFYTVEEDIPKEYCHLSTFKINGQKVYYVITEVIPAVVITAPDNYF